MSLPRFSLIFRAAALAALFTATPCAAAITDFLPGIEADRLRLNAWASRFYWKANCENVPSARTRITAGFLESDESGTRAYVDQAGPGGQPTNQGWTMKSATC